MRKVLIVTDEMEVGGSQKQICNILLNLNKSVFDPTLLYFRNPSFLVDELERQGIRTVQIVKKGKIDLVFFAKLVSFLYQERFDVVHAFSFTAELWSAFALIFTPTCLITSIRGKYEWYGKGHWLLKRWISKHSRWVVSNSQAGAQYATEKGALSSFKAQIIYNGVKQADTGNDEYLEHRFQSLKKNCDWLLTFVGRLVNHKNIHCLLRAINRINNAGVKLEVLIVGDGPEKKSLETIKQTLVLHNVHFLGEQHSVSNIFHISNAVVLPSFREGLSNTLLEAMQAGLAVVASDVGGNPEVISHEKTGLLFASDDDEALAEAIIRLRNDQAMTYKLGQQAKKEVESRFSIPIMIKRYEYIYSVV